MIVTGTSLKESVEAIQLCKAYPTVCSLSSLRSRRSPLSLLFSLFLVPLLSPLLPPCLSLLFSPSHLSGQVLNCTVGVHPHDAQTCNETTIEEMRKLAADPFVCAIGECGLDFDRMFSPQV